MRGFCKCGCGARTKIAPRNDKERGWVKGEPISYINGHYWRGRNDYPEKAKTILCQKYKKRVNTIENHPAWKGGFRICRGYMTIKQRGNPNADNQGYVKRCVLIAQKVLGRPLKKWKEVVHHINEDRLDDRNSNLLICDRGYHNYLHAKMKEIKNGPI